MASALAVMCHACSATMALVLEVPNPEGMADGVRIEVYQCSADGCGRKVDVIYEPVTGLTEPEKTWVEREVARTGAFFPSDYRPGRLRDW